MRINRQVSAAVNEGGASVMPSVAFVGRIVAFAALVGGLARAAEAQPPKAAKPPAVENRFGNRPILTQAQWSRLDGAVDRALLYLSKQQARGGAFPTQSSGQTAVTSLCILAFLSRGHVPGEGPYGDALTRAINSVVGPDGSIGGRGSTFESNYNLAIAGLMLGEVYGMTEGKQVPRVRAGIEKSLAEARGQQDNDKRWPADVGGWRYSRKFGVTDSDLSITAWQLMFLRSARNAEFEVPNEWIKDAMAYVQRSYDTKNGGFFYGLRGEDLYCSRAMAGAGVVALALGGEHNSEMARKTGDWILRNNFERYNGGGTHYEDRYHYSAFYCSQAMFQLGGKHWFEFFPDLLTVLADNQRRDGSWEAESNGNDHKYGQSYTTALMVLALTPPYQLLPIYQR